MRASAQRTGAGLALQHLSPRVTLLIFAVAVAIVILAATPILVRPAGRSGIGANGASRTAEPVGVDSDSTRPLSQSSTRPRSTEP